MRLMNPAFHQQQMTAPPKMSAPFQTFAPGPPPPPQTMLNPQDPSLIQSQTGGTAGAVTPGPSDQTASTGQGFFDFLGGLGDLFANNASTLAGIGSIAGALDNASDIRDLGYGVQEHLQNMGNTLNTGSQFQGYGVTSGTGENAINSTVGADGSINLNVGQDTTMATNGSTNLTNAQSAFANALGMSGGQGNVDWNSIAQSQMGASNGVNPNSGAFGAQGEQLFNNAMGMNPSSGNFGAQGQQLFQNAMSMNPNSGAFGGQSQQLFQNAMGMDPSQGWAGQTAQDAANRSMADPSQRQSEIFDQLMAIQNPELDRQQAAQQAREYAAGRGGVRGSAYGGTAEDAAMAKARAQASNQAALNAMQQADSERSMFGQMASQYGQLGNQNFANESNQMANLLNASSQQGQLGNQNYANQGNQMANLLNASSQQGQLGNQNFANESNLMSNLLNTSSQYGQLGNQNYANMTDREAALANNAAQLGQLGNQANANATQQAGMMGQIGNSLASLGLDQTKLSYLPMQMQMELLNQAQGTGSMAQTGQLTGQDYLAQMLLGGTDANINAQKVSSELMGNLYDSLLDNMGGQQNADGSGYSGISSLFSELGNLFGFGD